MEMAGSGGKVDDTRAELESSPDSDLIPDSVTLMGANQSRRRIPKVQFRVLIIGRANAGKTTILQRVCDTTESPTIYRTRGDEREEVCHGG